MVSMVSWYFLSRISPPGCGSNRNVPSLCRTDLNLNGLSFVPHHHGDFHEAMSAMSAPLIGPAKLKTSMKGTVSDSPDSSVELGGIQSVPIPPSTVPCGVVT